jgi:hypothetical protein
MKTQATELSLLRRWMAAILLLLTHGSFLVAATTVTVHQGQELAGEHVVLVVPLPSHEATVGIARQVGTLPLQRGTLTVIETESIPKDQELAGFLAESLPAEPRPDWVWIHQGVVPTDQAGQKLTSPTIRLQAADDQPVREAANRALGEGVSVALIRPELPDQIAAAGVLGFTYPSGTPLSRQIRHTRLLVTALLRSRQLLAEDEDFCWRRLNGLSPQLIALYDAEGIGGGGPVNLERIVAQQLPNVGIYRVCGDDIREGALAPAAGSIFPGGSGRGIGNGLQSEGREILREFISAGGGYLGVCAGAYFAASGLENYLHAIRLKHSQPWARGRTSLEIELTDEGQTLFGTDQRMLTTRYANGPVFLTAEQADGGDPDFVVLARFKTAATDSRGVVRSEMVGEAAIGALQYGRGRILIISPHPESHEQHHPLVAQAIQWTLEPTPCAP